MNKDRRKTLDTLQNALQVTRISEALQHLKEIHDALEAVRDEEQDAFDNLPESLQNEDREFPIEQLTEAMEKLEELIDGFDVDVLDEVFAHIEDAKGQA